MFYSNLYKHACILRTINTCVYGGKLQTALEAKADSYEAWGLTKCNSIEISAPFNPKRNRVVTQQAVVGDASQGKAKVHKRVSRMEE